MKRLSLLLFVGTTFSLSAADYYCEGCSGALLHTDTFCSQCGAKISFENVDGQKVAGGSSFSFEGSSYYQAYLQSSDVYFSIGLFNPTLALTIPFDAYSCYSLNGFAIGLFVDYFNAVNGVQIGSLNHAREMKGLQIGAFNTALKVYGVQIGLCNKVEEGLCGVQIGLLNSNKKGKIPVLPIINVGW